MPNGINVPLITTKSKTVIFISSHSLGSYIVHVVLGMLNCYMYIVHVRVCIAFLIAFLMQLHPTPSRLEMIVSLKIFS